MAVVSLWLTGAGHAEVLERSAALVQPIIDIRVRYESIDDKSKALHGDAATLRARLGFETRSWNNLSLAFDFDALVPFGVTGFNSTRNGKTAYPTVADPTMIALNRLQITYASDFDTKIVVGRQRLQLGDQRFVGNSGWRQHEQTFDAVTLVNNSLEDLTVTYSYLNGVNRVYGPNAPVPATGPSGHFASASHLFNAVYGGVPGLKLEGYAYLLDLSQKGPAPAASATSKLSTATYGVRGEYRLALGDGIAGQINAAFAHQQDYADNPLAIDLDYRLIEGGFSYRGLTALAGFEALGGNGAIGFSTPLASLHPFEGWADMFTATPVNGIDDLYLKGAYVIPGVLELKSLVVSVVHHDFEAERTGLGIGSEWDASLELAIDQHVSFSVAAAVYNGAGIGQGGFASKSFLWLLANFKS